MCEAGEQTIQAAIEEVEKLSFHAVTLATDIRHWRKQVRALYSITNNPIMPEIGQMLSKAEDDLSVALDRLESALVKFHGAP
jgi:hypothetical protein